MIRAEVLNYDDALYLARNMREIDKREIYALMFEDSPEQFAQECVSIGGICIKDKNGVPFMMCGIHECWPHVGNAWMVATDAISQNGISATKVARLLVTNKHYHRIQAMSAVFHSVSHAWLKLLGFTPVYTARQFGKNKEDYIMFERFNHV